MPQTKRESRDRGGCASRGQAKGADLRSAPTHGPVFPDPVLRSVFHIVFMFSASRQQKAFLGPSNRQFWFKNMISDTFCDPPGPRRRPLGLHLRPKSLQNPSPARCGDPPRAVPVAIRCRKRSKIDSDSILGTFLPVASDPLFRPGGVRGPVELKVWFEGSRDGQA